MTYEELYHLVSTLEDNLDYIRSIISEEDRLKLGEIKRHQQPSKDLLEWCIKKDIPFNRDKKLKQLGI